uniref:Uncharacterized protein n=1 Tax=Oryza brachyantha TaxID=4533 RepID=J3LC64_ORYBR
AADHIAGCAEPTISYVELHELAPQAVLSHLHSSKSSVRQLLELEVVNFSSR